MTTPTSQGRVDEHPGSTRQSGPRTAPGEPPARPTPWLGGAADGPGAHGGATADGNTEWFAADPPTQPLPVVREPRESREGTHSQPHVRAAAPVRQAPALRDVPVRDIARDQEPSQVSAPAPARVVSPAVGTLRDRVSTQDDDADWSPPPRRGPRTIPAPVKTSFRWWVVAVALAVLAMTLSVVLAVMYAGRYGTSAAGGATVGSILFEVLVLVGGGFVVVRMRAGDDWARTVLAGGGGLVALIVAMNTAGQFSFGSSLVSGFTTAIATVRLFEAASAAVAIWYMFQPGAGKHFDPRGREE